MIKLITYNQKGDSLFEFNYKNDVDIELNAARGDIIKIEATKQKIYYTSNMSFMAYNTELNPLPISSEWLDLSKQLVEQAYNGKDRILMVFSSADEPICIFKGNRIQAKYPYNGKNCTAIKGTPNLSKIMIDDKMVLLSNMHFIIISPKQDDKN